MRKNKNETNRRDSGAVGEVAGFAYYVVCLGEAAALGPLIHELKVDGMTEGVVCQIVAAELVAAVVSKVPLSEYGEAPLAANMGNLEWVAEKGMAHERIVQSFGSRATVIPLRFGAIFLAEHAIRSFLEYNARGIAALTSRLNGKEEWGLNIYCDRGVLSQAVALSNPEVGKLTRQVAGASPGQAFLLGKTLDTLKDRVSRDEIKRVVEAVGLKAEAAADSSVRLGFSKYSQVDRGALVARYALLVSKAGFEEFRRQAEALAFDYHDLGFSIELAGPMPPYSFIDGLNSQSAL
jgi:hypothetical protein